MFFTINFVFFQTLIFPSPDKNIPEFHNLSNGKKTPKETPKRQTENNVFQNK